MDGEGPRRLPRRALIVAGAAGAAAAALQAVAPPGAIHAAQGGTAVIGAVNEGTDRTVFRSTQSDGVEGMSQVPTKSGVYGVNSDASGYGVFGRNAALDVTGYVGGPGHGAWGESGVDKYSGVYGRATNAGAFGVSGNHLPSGNMGRLGTALAGAEGRSDTSDGVRGEASAAQKAGVLGLTNDALGKGVTGRNTTNGNQGGLGGGSYGAFGIHSASGNNGVLGTGEAGVLGIAETAASSGVKGINDVSHTVGLLGAEVAGLYASGTDARPAVFVDGVAHFVRAGVAVVPKGQVAVRVPGVKAAAFEAAVATLGTYRAGIAVAAAVIDDKAGTLTISLTKKVASDTPVAWMLFAWGPMT